jgi:hypothetical protein
MKIIILLQKVTYVKQQGIIRKAGVVVTLQNYIREVLASNVGWDTGYSDWVSNSFPQTLQTTSRIIQGLGYDSFLPNPFQFINRRYIV